MTCGTWVLYEERRRKGSGKLYRKATRFYHSEFPRTAIPDDQLKRLEICDGKIVATVDIEVDGGCGCCGTTSVRIAYRCEKCRAECFPHLPQNADALSTFVTAALERL